MHKFQGSLNIVTARLNPEGVSHNSKADLKRIITDKVSARSIAEYLVSHSDKVIYQQQDYWGSLRKQWSFVKMLTKQSTQLLNQLESLVYSANPEILRYCRKRNSCLGITAIKAVSNSRKVSKGKIFISFKNTIHIHGTCQTVNNDCKDECCICY